MSTRYVLPVALFASVLATPLARAQFDLPWYTIDSGGVMFSTGGTFSLGGTIGQPDAGPVMSGGTFDLTGGFWAVAADTPCPGDRADANCDGGVDFFDIDPFLLALFNPPQYATQFCGGSTCAADADCSGLVDFFDIDPFLDCLFVGCTNCP